MANTDGIVRFPYRDGDLKARGKPEHIADLSSGGRLTGGGHWTRDIVFSKDGSKLFASIGSKTNVDDETSEPEERERARIFRFNPDGSERMVYAWGLRNAVGIAVRPETGELWASVNERKYKAGREEGEETELRGTASSGSGRLSTDRAERELYSTRPEPYYLRSELCHIRDSRGAR